jgi:hypothetical protein
MMKIMVAYSRITSILFKLLVCPFGRLHRHGDRDSYKAERATQPEAGTGTKLEQPDSECAGRR